MIRPFLLLPLAMMAACSQNPDGSTAFGTKGSPAWFMTASPEAISGHYQTSCQSYGFRAGTVEMARCIERSAEGERSAGRQGMTEALSRFGEQQRASAAQYSYRQPSYDRPVTCQSYVSYAGTRHTSCY